MALVLGFFLFSTSDPDFMGVGKENQQSEAGEAGNPSEKAVAGNEVEGEKGQGAGGGVAKETPERAEPKVKERASTQTKSQTAAASRVIPYYASGVMRPTSATPPKKEQAF